MTTNNTTPRKLEVRCCCDPSILYGYLELPEHCCWDGCSIPTIAGTVSVRRFAERLAIPKERFQDDKQDAKSDRWRIENEPGWEQCELPATAKHFEFRKARLAVASNDIPLEKLQMIPGFVEA